MVIVGLSAGVSTNKKSVFVFSCPITSEEDSA
jgi:hypothetical protein